MKTISVQPGMIMRLQDTQLLAPQPHARMRPSTQPQWRPVPRTASARPEVRRPQQSKANIWIPLETECLAENLLTVLLVLVALGAIGYGFSSLVDFVQGWNGLNSWVSQLVQ
jgi:hypothetical protein